MDTAAKLEAHERECSIRYASFEDKLDHIDKRLWRLEALMMASTSPSSQLLSVCTCDDQTRLRPGRNPGRSDDIDRILVLDTCLWYAKRLNSQHHHTYHRHHPKNESIHAKCLPRRVDPRTVEIFDH